jgi:hypothetical protein
MNIKIFCRCSLFPSWSGSTPVLIQGINAIFIPQIPTCHVFKKVCKGCPNKNARFKVRATVILLGWRHWKFNFCHLSLLRLVVTERYTKEQHVIIVKMHYKYGESYAETVRKVSSHAMVIRIGHWGRAIWHCATSFFGSLWNLVSMPTNHKQFLSSRRRFDVSLAKMSCNYVEMSSRISSKEQECASRVVGSFVGYCVPQLIAVCVLYTEIKISELFE